MVESDKAARSCSARRPEYGNHKTAGEEGEYGDVL
jgi:hypothetical protein